MNADRWDIFCRVVDNYGDASIAWRLARQLALEHRLEVRLFIDVLHALARIASDVDPARKIQRVRGVEVRAWEADRGGAASDDPGVNIVEAFGCGLAPAYLDAMAARHPKPAWINLEYLSAENWIEGCHGLASPHPRLPLSRRFYFPGFTLASGGLLRESGLLDRRDAFVADTQQRMRLWEDLDLPLACANALTVSLFCYADAPLASLLDTWADGDDPVLCIVPEGVAAGALDRWTAGRMPHRGLPLTRGRLTLAVIPFMDQDEYDRLLWACDANFVRGEDSFVRAQWAGRPFVWQAYPQAENAHRLKVDAFLALYTEAMDHDAGDAVKNLSNAWNQDGDAGATWKAFAAQRRSLQSYTRSWADRLASQRDLASGMVRMAANKV